MVALSGLFLTTLVWGRRHAIAGRPFLIVISAGTVWAVADWINLLTNSNDWLTIGFISVHTVSVAYLIFCLEYTGRKHSVTRSRILIAAVIPAITTILEATNDWHYLIWRPQVGRSDSFGAIWWVSTLYDYSCLAAGTLLLVLSLRRVGRAQRRRTRVIVVAALLPWIADLIQLLPVYPAGLPNPATVALGFSSTVIFFGLYHFDLLEATVAEQVLMAGMADAAILVDGKDQILQMNPSAERLFGRSAAESEGKKLDWLVRDWPEFFRHLTPDTALSFETSRTVHGNTFYYDVQVSEIYAGASWKAGRSIVIHDATAETRDAVEREQLLADLRATNESLVAEATVRSKAQEQLDRTEASWRGFCEGTVMGIYRTTPDGRIVMANRGLVEMLGYDSLEEMASVDLEGPGFSDSYDREAFKHRMTTDGVIIGQESEWRRKDGSHLWVRENARAIRHPDGTIRFYEGTVEDISQRKSAEAERLRIEQQILQVQKMESLGVLVGGIAHDFNNLLTAILANAELARDEVRSGLRPVESLDEIRATTLRAADLSRQMQAYVGKGRLETGQIDLSQLVGNMLDLLRASVSVRAALVYEGSQEPARINGDATQIRQILLNLVVNAAEAMPDRRGRIRVSTGVTECTEEFLRAASFTAGFKPGRYAGLCVEDNGHGMDAATIARIFEPFFTTKASGRGWGLSAVLGIVRSHSGALAVHSTPGKGTRFDVLFPLVDQPVIDAVRSPHAPGVAPKGRTILLVDDDDTLRAVCAKLLSSLGYRVIPAEGGAKAVELVRTRGSEIDIVLLDLTMPEIDGEETFRRLRALDPAIKVLFTSGFSQSDSSFDRQFSGANGFIPKPYTRDSLMEHLARVLT